MRLRDTEYLRELASSNKLHAVKAGCQSGVDIWNMVAANLETGPSE